jgi:hypothetical protein
MISFMPRPLYPGGSYTKYNRNLSKSFVNETYREMYVYDLLITPSFYELYVTNVEQCETNWIMSIFWYCQVFIPATNYRVPLYTYAEERVRMLLVSEAKTSVQQLTCAECNRSVNTAEHEGVCLSPRDEVIGVEEHIYGSPEQKGQQLKHWRCPCDLYLCW